MCGPRVPRSEMSEEERRVRDEVILMLGTSMTQNYLTPLREALEVLVYQGIQCDAGGLIDNAVTKMKQETP